MYASPLESQIRKRIIKKLRERGGFWFNTHGGPMQVMGLPDIIGCYKGHFFGFEVKRPGRALTPTQAFTIRRLQAEGGTATVVHSFEEAAAILEEADRLLGEEAQP